MENPCVRFDDLSPGGAGSFGLVGLTRTITAKRLEEVVPTLQAAEAAAADGQWVAGFVSYEAAPAFASDLTVRPPGLHDPMRELPLAQFGFFGGRVDLEDIESDHFPAGEYNVSAWSPDSSRRDYRDTLAHVGRSIMSGEVVRGAHTFRLHAAFSGDPGALYRDLLRSQRGPHAACVDLGRFRLVSASPQRFFKRTGDTLTASPVLASVPRGRWLEEDRQMASRLAGEGELGYSDRVVVKEVEAELAEIGDLASMPLEDRLTIERLEVLWQLTAKIGVKVRPEVGLVDIFRVLFPSASVTGIPKREGMSLVAATEESARGVYCGAIGFLSPADSDGPDASFSVAVRTVVVDQEEGVAEFGVGSAITNRSDVISAYEEARLKAKILVDRRPDFQIRERFRVEHGVVRAAKAKVDTVLESARYFGFDIDRATVNAAIKGLGGIEESVIDFRVDRHGATTVDLLPAPSWAETADEAPEVEGVVAAQSVSTDNIFLFHRTTDSRLSDSLARLHPDATVVVLVNDHDEVAGSLEGNVAMLFGDQWTTPPRGCGNAPTALRDRLVEGGSVVERVTTVDQLSVADGVAILDDVHGWRRVRLAR